jgi:DNA-binding transcriptional ArsR family regulator
MIRLRSTDDTEGAGMMQRLGTVDLDTGELVEGVSIISVQQRAKFKEPFMLVFQKGLEALAKDRTLRGESTRVLFALMGRLDYENFIHVSHAEVARHLGVERSNVSRAIAQLLERGVLIAGPKVGNVSTYRLSDTLGWKGRVKAFQESRAGRLRVAVNNVRGKRP